MHAFDSLHALAVFLRIRDLANNWLLAYAILAARPATLMAILPVFSRAQLTGPLLGAVAAAVIMPFWGSFASEFAQHPPGLAHALIVTIKESIMGVALGVALSLPFWAMMIAGELMDTQRGQTNLKLADPAGGEEMSASGTILVMASIIVYVASGGLNGFIDTLYQSWTVWRPMDLMPVASQATPVLILELGDAIMRRGYELALPMIFAMLLADTAMVIIIRMAPQLHLDNVMSALRNLVYAVFLPLYLGYLLFYSHQDQAATAKAISIIAPMLHPTHEGAGILPSP